jgi:hypothetical protein
MRKDLLKLKYFILLLVLSLGLFVYASLSGRRYIGSDSSKWSPQEQGGYHK